MAQHVLVCDEAWSGSSCGGTTSSVDIEGLMVASAPFDWALIDPASLAALFVSGFGIVLTVWVVAFGASAVLEVVRKS